jgi:hypothetical protein
VNIDYRTRANHIDVSTCRGSLARVGQFSLRDDLGWNRIKVRDRERGGAKCRLFLFNLAGFGASKCAGVGNNERERGKGRVTRSHH